ncbi:hypothetical protein MN116_002163 [Schistosoma mekongi]|uniref:Uncharacterized protein n=1 Tax=Schistosoma mekongi TaxID=38744 RepID=A0AAE1ZJ83_SCHME|nr:hypothetical protein MN116_002163 [Schistosoma mekongi]
MMKAWQLVDINGEVINEEDVSSVGSDWSFMQFDPEDGYPSRPHSVAGRRPEVEVEYNSRSPSSNSDYNCYDSHCSLEKYTEPAVRSKNTDKSSKNKHLPATTPGNQIGRISSKTETLKSHPRNGLRPGHIHQSSTKHSNGSRHVLARWNACHKQNNCTNLCVDSQRSKCLRRGAIINHGFQRRQVRMGNGGHIPHQRS